ncbi:septum formation protein Maf [Neoehrlichia mikurensis]|uniref:Nucleoside triphosphate pyrophosphatase n=1 Tax=Neoehrlichia mikurensis TaxID=89586 RepID=A0A9Q9BZD8_9RICK|nr:Maf family nucleotide pyrophosphatase [Neoehrlichia mikurensis]QXK91875.1 septum formation protein Maf [Neoehrlichia mikurensis]QXK93088.1 septum formation protein Maf [Neoehrlichia mikurensis]QXK93568.1 septum formation protein Maf [Neoehrlichia mikurensis]UTO55479.1 Maf family nucleotide pyrophosphatase [Neoehrlichia mikurensis]UTO56399.1 Maf family nucleotide pyrophosphatase [Neoehrlichia mikurensis]
MIKIKDLILASSSRQRIDLLEQIGVLPEEVVFSEIDESYNDKELPKDYSIRIVKSKVEKVKFMHPNKFILGADTVVCCGRRILLKAKNQEQAIQYMKLLSGRRHRVYTAICLYTPENKFHVKSVMTVVKFKRLSEKEIDYYINLKQWYEKAGGYSIQGYASAFIVWIKGSYSSVVGLPLHETYCLLSSYFDFKCNS